MLLIDGPRQHDYIAITARHQGKPLFRRIHIRQLAQDPTQPPNLNSQACPMRFVGMFRPEGASDESVS
jgi:hypothetical protein